MNHDDGLMDVVHQSLGDGDGPSRYGLLADIETEVMVVLGRTALPIREIVALTPGAVLELDRRPTDPADVLVNGVTIARGEVVVVDGEFGVRITEILEPRRPR
jgi:flagellar motor switch protein FliN/FliY